jgi:hypothetical protein
MSLHGGNRSMCASRMLSFAQECIACFVRACTFNRPAAAVRRFCSVFGVIGSIHAGLKGAWWVF